jgi:hypothetical protein
MSVPEQLTNLTGNWTGINRLHLPWMPENPIQESQSEALVAFSAQGKFLKIEYDWTFENKKQDGMILLGNDKNANLIKAFWVDSWHMDNKFLVSEGEKTDNNIISIKGFYSVPDHPDWGWRTTFESANKDSFKITMFNVSPEGEESLAVELNYQRK